MVNKLRYPSLKKRKLIFNDVFHQYDIFIPGEIINGK